MTDKLAGGERRRYEFGAEHHRIQAPFEKPDHLLPGIAGLARGLLVIAPELPLGDVAVIALQLLLGMKLCAIVGELARLPLTVLTGTIGAAADRTFVAAPDILAHAAVELVFRGRALRHAVFLARVEGAGGTELPPKGGHYSHGLLTVKRPSTSSGPGVGKLMISPRRGPSDCAAFPWSR